MCRQVMPGEPWFEGCLSGVGDCAHATRPDLGQGGAMAIEVHVCRSDSATCLLPASAYCSFSEADVLRQYATSRVMSSAIGKRKLLHWDQQCTLCCIYSSV